jgi:hypothetical protein
VNMNNSGKNDTAMEPRSKQRPTKLGSQALPSGLVHNLEELRSCVLRRLESIEALARRCSGVPSVEIARTEQMLRQRIDELELERNRALSEPVSEEQSGNQLLTQLENDRQLLAEAWERLERERIDAVMAGSVARHAPAAHHPHPAEGHATHSLPTPRPTVAVDTANPVAESILRQFQSLCSDVRRTTNARCSTH